jgi:hypothetical protein
LETLIEREQLIDISLVLENLLNGAAVITCVAFIGTVVGVFFNLDTVLILPTSVFCGITTIGWYFANNYCRRKMREYDGV